MWSSTARPRAYRMLWFPSSAATHLLRLRRTQRGSFRCQMFTKITTQLYRGLGDICTAKFLTKISQRVIRQRYPSVEASKMTFGAILGGKLRAVFPLVPVKDVGNGVFRLQQVSTERLAARALPHLIILEIYAI